MEIFGRLKEETGLCRSFLGGDESQHAVLKERTEMRARARAHTHTHTHTHTYIYIYIYIGTVISSAKFWKRKTFAFFTIPDFSLNFNEYYTGTLIIHHFSIAET